VAREGPGDPAALVPRGDRESLAAALAQECAATSTAEQILERQARARRWTWEACAQKAMAAYEAAPSQSVSAVPKRAHACLSEWRQCGVRESPAFCQLLIDRTEYAGRG